MSKSQVNFRLPDTLIAALKEKAETEGKTTTEIAVSILESGLGLSSADNSDSRITSIEERIAAQLEPLREQVNQLGIGIEKRVQIAIQSESQAALTVGLDERISAQLIPLQTHLEDRIAECITIRLADSMATCLELLQVQTEERISVLLDKRIADTQELLLSQLNERISTTVYNRIAAFEKQPEAHIEEAIAIDTLGGNPEPVTPFSEPVEAEDAITTGKVMALTYPYGRPNRG